MKKVWFILFALIFILTAFAACSGKKSASPGDTSAASPGESNPYTTKWSIASIYSEITGDFWSIAYNGYQKAEAELAAYGIESYCLAPANTSDPALQTALIYTALKKGVDGIVLSPVHADIIGEYVADTFTKDHGCPIVVIDYPITIDYSLNAESSWFVATVTTDLYAMGEEAGRLAEEAMGGEGLYIVLGARPSSSSFHSKDMGALYYLEDNVPGMEKAADVFWSSQNTKEQYIAFVQDQCTRHPDEPIAFLSAGEAAAGKVTFALADLAEMGTKRSAGDVVVAWDFFSADLAPIADGELYGVAAHNPFLMGYNAVYTLLDYLEGARIPEFIAVPYCVITKNNLESEEVKEYMAMNGISA